MAEGKNEARENMNTEQIQEYTKKSRGKMQVQISSFAKGLEVFEKISIIRVRSKKSKLLIMEDYMPIIGELDGDIDLIGKDVHHSLENIKGFFCHEHNVFFLLLKESYHA